MYTDHLVFLNDGCSFCPTDKTPPWPYHLALTVLCRGRGIPVDFGRRGRIKWLGFSRFSETDSKQSGIKNALWTGRMNKKPIHISIFFVNWPQVMLTSARPKYLDIRLLERYSVFCFDIWIFVFLLLFLNNHKISVILYICSIVCSIKI